MCYLFRVYMLIRNYSAHCDFCMFQSYEDGLSWATHRRRFLKSYYSKQMSESIKSDIRFCFDNIPMRKQDRYYDLNRVRNGKFMSIVGFV